MLVPKGMTWSTNAKVNVPYETLKVLKENGLRLFTVGFETGSQHILNNVKKGMKVEWAHEFAENCHKLGIKMHGTFIVGLPGETKETIRETIEFVKRINPHTIQVSLPAPLPGTFLYDQAKRRAGCATSSGELVAYQGFQVTTLEYPHLSHRGIFAACRSGSTASSSSGRVRSPRSSGRCSKSPHGHAAPAARGRRVPRLPARARQPRREWCRGPRGGAGRLALARPLAGRAYLNGRRTLLPARAVPGPGLRV